MIEFITLSRSKEVPKQLANSIAMMMLRMHPWNLTVIDGEKHDLFNGYNAGAAETKGEYLAFVHDDVQFLGNPLTMARPLQCMENPQCGFIGVAGSRILVEDGCWWAQNTSIEVLTNCRGMVAHPNDGDFGLRYNTWPPGSALFGQVLVMDGVLLMCHRRTFEALGGFDAKNYTGFHFYDVDITFRAAMELKLVNLVAPIPILHLSPGAMQEDWERNRQIFVRKFAGMLPARV